MGKIRCINHNTVECFVVWLCVRKIERETVQMFQYVLFFHNLSLET